MNYTSKEVYEYISLKNSDPIIERKTCTVSGQPFAIFQSDLDFYKKISPTFAGQRFQIPTPTLCPEERQRRRISFRNFFKLKKRICSATGTSIITQYDEPYTVYANNYRRSDYRDPLEFGQDINFEESFFAQWQKLSLKVPRYATHNLNCENSDYCNMAANSKNCYLVAWCITNEDCMYGHIVWQSQDSLDILYSKRCNQCYWCIDCLDCNNVIFWKNSENCTFSSYIIWCMNCTYCIGCVWLNNKSYCIFNKQYTKEEYENQKSNLNAFEIENSVLFLLQEKPLASYRNVQCENVIGNENTESYNLTFAYDAIQSEDSKYLYTVAKCNYSQDVCYTWLGWDWNYESLFPYGNNLYFTHNCQDSCNNVYYSENCYVCSNCFWCIGLRNKSYCIFNKQYTKEEYDILVSRIIIHMQETWERWEFFHPSLSPFCYNQTIAQEYFPFTKQEALARWYKREDKNLDPIIPEWAKVIDWKVIKEDPKEYEQILKSIFVCEVSGRPYRIIKQELEFYRKHHLPLPRKHPDIRHEERMKLRPWRTLYLRKCDQCNQENLSVYWTDYQWKVYCESCYQQRVYW